MKKYEFTMMGEFHVNHNEDYLLTHEIGENNLMIAVMDGCSMGSDSYFAATIIGKLLRKISQEIHYKEFVEKNENSLEEILKKLLNKLFINLKDLNNRLALERDEMLSTLILGLVNHQHKSAEIMVIGDGLVCCNGELKEYEQDNKPDYLGYHLNSEFDIWYEKQTQRLTLNQVNDLSISTDGIFTFQRFDQGNYEDIRNELLIDLLLKNKEGMESEYMLKRKIIDIEKKWGLRPTDDLSIIRIILN